MDGPRSDRKTEKIPGGRQVKRQTDKEADRQRDTFGWFDKQTDKCWRYIKWIQQTDKQALFKPRPSKSEAAPSVRLSSKSKEGEAVKREKLEEPLGF